MEENQSEKNQKYRYVNTSWSPSYCEHILRRKDMLTRKMPNKYNHRWVRQLTRQTSIPVYLLSIKDPNFHFPFPFAANKWKFVISVFRLQQTNVSCCFPLVPFAIYMYGKRNFKKIFYIYICIHRHVHICTYTYIYIYICIHYHFKWKTEDQVFFFNPFTV